MRERFAIGILATLLLLSAGCRRPVSRALPPNDQYVAAGVISVRSPIRLAMTTDRAEPSDDGVTSHLRIWEGRTSVYGLLIASLERDAPFTGPRDRILESSMGEQIRGGRLGEVTYDYRGGVFTARADALIDGGSVHVRAFMSRRHLAVVVCGGRTDPVLRTMDSITVLATNDELFFAPVDPSTGPGMHVAWGLGFSCRMPGGVTVTESDRGTLRYAAHGDGYDVQAYVYANPDPLDAQRTRAIGTGELLEQADVFEGGLLIRTLVVHGAEGRWHAWMLTPMRAFHLSAAGSAPTPRDREAISDFFASCAF